MTLHRVPSTPPQMTEVSTDQEATIHEKNEVQSTTNLTSSLRQHTGTRWTIASCALANLSDGFQQNLASSTNVIFNHIYGSKIYTSTWQTRSSNALLVGSIVGILVLGYTSDLYSRRGGMVFTSLLVIVGTLIATLMFQIGNGGRGDRMLWVFTIARGIAGVGVGGEYPCSAASALENSQESYDHFRGPIQVLSSTLMATSGAPFLIIVYLLTLIASGNNLEMAFHAIYGIATILPLLLILARLRMREGILFRQSNFKKSGIPWRALMKQRKYIYRLIGTCTAFFLYDFINFPNSIMSAAIINDIVPGKDIRTVAIWQLILSLFPVPGVLLGAWLVNKIGRRWTGILGFGGYITLGFLIGGCYGILTEDSKNIAGFVVCYGLLQAMGHMGPGATIGLMSVESFPTSIRGIGYGISAGFGKAGAAVGTQAFTPLEDAFGKASTFYLAGAVGILGTAVYWFLPEGRGVNLARMDREFEEDLAREGWIVRSVEEDDVNN